MRDDRGGFGLADCRRSAAGRNPERCNATFLSGAVIRQSHALPEAVRRRCSPAGRGGNTRRLLAMIAPRRVNHPRKRKTTTKTGSRTMVRRANRMTDYMKDRASHL